MVRRAEKNKTIINITAMKMEFEVDKAVMKPLFFMKTTKMLARKDQWQIPWLHLQLLILTNIRTGSL